MTQGFLTALAVGFLGTMIPRRTGTSPLTWTEIVFLAGALLLGPALAQLGEWRAAQACFAVVLGALLRFAVSRLASGSRTQKPPPPSFVLLPLAVLGGFTGAVLLAIGEPGGVSPKALLGAKQLVQQGMILGLILALAPMLAPIIVGGRPPHFSSEGRKARVTLNLGLGIVFLASFVLEAVGWTRWGLFVRGVVCTALLGDVAWGLRREIQQGVHRALFLISMGLIPLGLLAAALAPVRRIQLLHVTFIGGFALMALAVSVHVTMSHAMGGTASQRRPPLVILGGVFLLGSTAVRVAAENHPQHFFHALVLAASLWLACVVAWGAFLLKGVTTRQPKS